MRRFLTKSKLDGAREMLKQAEQEAADKDLLAAAAERQTPAGKKRLVLGSFRGRISSGPVTKAATKKKRTGRPKSTGLGKPTGYELEWEVTTFRKEQIDKKALKRKAPTWMPYVKFKSGHIVTCTPSGWNIVETEVMFNDLVLLAEFTRRREIMFSPDASGLVTGDNYIVHTALRVTRECLDLAGVPHIYFVPNSTCQVQYMDTDANGQLKSMQASKQGQQLLEVVTEQLESKPIPDDIRNDREKLLAYIPPEDERITIPTVTRGQVLVNTLISWAELSHSLDGAGFVSNGQAARTDGTRLRLSERIKEKQGKTSGGGKTSNSKVAKTQDDSIARVFARYAQCEIDKHNSAESPGA